VTGWTSDQVGTSCFNFQNFEKLRRKRWLVNESIKW